MTKLHEMKGNKREDDPENLNIAGDLDQEVKLLAQRTGVSTREARKLINESGSFKEALRRIEGIGDAKP